MGVIIPQVVTEDRAGGAQVIDGSLRFDSSRPTVLLRRPSSAGNQKTFTYSCWVKRTLLTGQIGGHGLLAVSGNSSSTQFSFNFMGTSAGNPNALETFTYSSPLQTSTSAVFRDTSAWYHVVLVIDTTQSTAAAQAKYYVNGVQQTLGVANAFTQNADTAINGTRMHSIGSLRGGTDNNQNHYDSDFYLSQIYLIDGQALDPSYFGFTDPLTNTWRPKKLSSSVAFGTNGFYLPLDGNTPIGQDQSGRGNNWTPVNFGGSNTIEKATGALPILNTDGGGKVARVGVRTDSSASSLVLALPLVGIKSDFSNAINSGTSNKAITANGNAAASSAQSNFYGGSFYFDGDGDYLSLAANVDFNLGNIWTIETWYYFTQNYQNIFDINYENFQLYHQDNGSGYGWYCDIRGDQTTSNQSAGTPAGTSNLNQWNHVALVSDGTTFKFYINGVAVGTSGNATVINVNVTTNSYPIWIGRRATSGGGSAGYYVNGYLQDFRVYKGTAKYTQNFIPASTDPDILPDTPSGAAYSSNVALVPSTDGAVAFDGSGDYLSLADSADFDLAGNDFTIEAFVYHTRTDYASYEGIIGQWVDSSGTNLAFVLETVGSGATSDLEFYYYDTSNNFVGPVQGAALQKEKWHHVAACRSGSTIRIFVDGVMYGSGTSISVNIKNSTNNVTIGGNVAGAAGYWNGFISNVHVVKGTALYTSNFTPPTAPISSVANTKLLCCKSNSSATAADVIPSGLSISAVNDAKATNFNPFNVNINTQRGQESGYCTLNPLDIGGGTLSNGNLEHTYNSSNIRVRTTISIPASGKWYAEFVASNTGGGNSLVGVSIGTNALTGYVGQDANSWGCQIGSGTMYTYHAGGYSSFGAAVSGDVIAVAVDRAAGKIWWAVNNTWIGSGDPANGSNARYTNIPSTGELFFAISNQNSSSIVCNFGQKPFKFPPPAGFQPLALANTPRPTIVRPDKFVGIVTYTGNGGTQSLNVGFKPDLVWIKNRSRASFNVLFDIVRGASTGTTSSTNKALASDATDPEGLGSTIAGLTSFNSNGFTLASDQISPYNATGPSSELYVAWCWKAGGFGGGLSYWKDDIGYSTAAAAGLTAGTITPTGASVNTKSGFSIITYTGTGAAATIDHGLGVTPAMVIVKRRNSSSSWHVGHKNLSAGYTITLEGTVGQYVSDSGYVNIGSSTSTVIQLTAGSATINNVNINTGTYVAYCWAEIPGFSKFGNYTGTNAASNFVYLGFRPALVIIKLSSASSSFGSWLMYDNKRNNYNPENATLWSNKSTQEGLRGDGSTSYSNALDVDFTANGFRIVNASSADEVNWSPQTYIYAAWAEAPAQNLFGGQSNAR